MGIKPRRTRLVPPIETHSAHWGALSIGRADAPCELPLSTRRLWRLLEAGASCFNDATYTIQSELERQEQDAIVELHHVHLPHLANAGFIEWDQESKRIIRGPQFEDLHPHLVMLREQS
ncbi:DUF7344 domain-containing protein [Natronorubrum tibetense]